jgi:hypothetical protein
MPDCRTIIGYFDVEKGQGLEFSSFALVNLVIWDQTQRDDFAAIWLG